MKPSFHDHFSQVAVRYANFRPQYPDELFDYLATLVPGDAQVWDCGAGSGQATVNLAARFARVVSTDASTEQIASATPLPNVDYRVALAEQSGLPDASIGLVTVAQALHWFDLPRFYAEVRRVLRPDGLLAVWCYGINEVEGEIVNQLVQEYYAGTLGPYWPSSRQLVESGYLTLPFPFAEFAPSSFNMEVRWTLEHLLGYFSTWSATNRFIQVNRHNPLEPLAEQLARVWGDANKPRRVTWPLSMRIGRNNPARM
jgi:ubiquinone/menaquinone biosynthesis C-methylase UbiE